MNQACPRIRRSARRTGRVILAPEAAAMDEDAVETPSAVIERGRILCYRVYDVGDTIALDVAERLLGAKRVAVGGPLAFGLVIPVRPLELALDSCVVEIPSVKRLLTATCSAHVFEFGAISLLYDLPIDAGTALETLTPLCDALYDSPELERLGQKHRGELMQRLGASIETPHGWNEAETYTVVFIEKLACTTYAAHRASVAALATSEAVAKLLLGEVSDEPLSPQTRDDVLKNAFSYLVDDLVVIDWNSALVVEPSGSRIVPFVLELATSQLLEFRFYDRLLDRELKTVYDTVETARPRVLRSPYGRLVRTVLRRFMELTEFTERVERRLAARDEREGDHGGSHGTVVSSGSHARP